MGLKFEERTISYLGQIKTMLKNNEMKVDYYDGLHILIQNARIGLCTVYDFVSVKNSATGELYYYDSQYFFKDCKAGFPELKKAIK